MQNAVSVTSFHSELQRAQIGSPCCMDALTKRSQSRAQDRAHDRAQILRGADAAPARAC